MWFWQSVGTHKELNSNFESAPTLPCALPKDQHGRTWRADLLFSGH